MFYLKEATERSLRYVRIYIVVTGLIIVSAAVVYKLHPTWHARIFAEDRLVEILTALVYLDCPALALIVWMKTKANGRLLSFCGVVGLLGFLDEVSYGSRAFGLSPLVINNVSLDTIHDLPLLALTFLIASLYLWISFLTIATAAAVIVLRRNRHRIAGWLKTLMVPPYFFLAAFVALGVMASTIDTLDGTMDIARRWVRWMEVFEESMELCAAIGLLFAVFTVWRRDRSSEKKTSHRYAGIAVDLSRLSRTALGDYRPPGRESPAGRQSPEPIEPTTARSALRRRIPFRRRTRRVKP